MHHIFITKDNIIDDTIVIKKSDDNDNYNHLVRSLRVNVGENVLCSIDSFEYSFDYRAEVLKVSDDEMALKIKEKMEPNELNARINLYQGINKSDKLEFIIEKSVELGVSSIIPVATEYCVAKIDEKKSGRKLERFNSIARAAAEQSKRHIIPEVKAPISFSEMIDQISKDQYNMLFYENAAGIDGTKEVLSEISKKCKKDNITINVIIGAEGGFSAKEIKEAEDAKVKILSLGDRILRTETAAVTALSIIMYELS